MGCGVFSFKNIIVGVLNNIIKCSLNNDFIETAIKVCDWDKKYYW